MSRNVLIAANTARFLVLLLRSDIRILKELGYSVHCASNFKTEMDGDAANILEDLGVTIHQIDISRNPLSYKNYNAYKQLVRIMQENRVDTIHCHTPMGGVLGRLAARYTRAKHVIYTAHGFHFYKGAPLMNWLVYFPVEWLLARYTDVLITINKEDYERAQKFAAKKVSYVPGVGIDTSKFSKFRNSREKSVQGWG